MKKKLTKPLNKKGFTLLELLVAIVIFGLMAVAGATAYSNIYGDSSVRTAALGINKDFEEIFKMSSKYSVDKTSEITGLNDLTTNNYLSIIPAPPAQSLSVAGTTYAWDTTSYSGWGTVGADSVVKLANVTKGSCSKFNELFAGAAANADPPAAVDYTKKAQCFGAGPYTALAPVYTH